MCPLRVKRISRLLSLVAMLACVRTMAQEAPIAPLLTLDQAIQIAIANNRTLKIAGLDVDKSKWDVASAKSERFPQTKGYLFASGNLTQPTFIFKEGTFGTIANTPIPAKDTPIPLSQGVTGYAFAQVAQPISQLYKIHLFIRE
ncbi:MAG TPA: TolC family protein, partial [Terriglobales bacterium]|nr:TolC family protein [Terriglobales bacterium]